MKKTLLTLAAIMLVNIHVYSNKIYTWIDQEGVTHFSDSNNSNQDAKAISDTPQSIVKTNANQDQKSKDDTNRNLSTQKNQLANINISIIKPISNETFQNTRGQPINVVLTGTENVFKQSGYIELNVDNKINRTFTSGNSFYINSPDRGKHNLQAIVYSQSGQKITESQNIIFYIQDQTARDTAGSTVINNDLYNNQATPVNYNNFRVRNQNQLVNPVNYNSGFKPTSKAYIHQVTGGGG